MTDFHDDVTSSKRLRHHGRLPERLLSNRQLIRQSLKHCLPIANGNVFIIRVNARNMLLLFMLLHFSTFAEHHKLVVL
jgi:hypothetical protein